jgi:hypothetical protein
MSRFYKEAITLKCLRSQTRYQNYYMWASFCHKNSYFWPKFHQFLNFNKIITSPKTWKIINLLTQNTSKQSKITGFFSHIFNKNYHQFSSFYQLQMIKFIKNLPFWACKLIILHILVELQFCWNLEKWWNFDQK